MQIADMIHTYPGYFGCESQCRLRIYATHSLAPLVFVATEMPDNPGTSITNAVERLIPSARNLVRQRGAPSLASAPFSWIEHYPADDQPERFAQVVFPRGKPEWRFISREQVETLIGEPLP
jgi:hypothetical protein